MIEDDNLNLLRDMECQVFESIEEGSLPADLPRTNSNERGHNQ